jgi:acetolactate synthase-1/2/3 large subunit
LSDAGTGELIALALDRAGTRHIFTLNGGHIWGILMAATDHDIKLIDVRHEQTAAFAAEGWSKLTRTCGVAAVTAGPGVLNTVSAIGNAWGSDTPLLVIGGRSPLSTAGTGSLQEMDHLPILNSITKSATTTMAASEVYAAISDALTAALQGRPGPTFVDVPADVFFDSAEEPPRRPTISVATAEADPDEVIRAASLIAHAKQPCLIAGSGVWWAHAEDELVSFLEAADVPAVLNGLARGILPSHHRLQATRARKVSLAEADVVIVAGAPLDFRLGFGRSPVIRDDAKLIYVDFDSRGRHRPGAAALDGDIRKSLKALALSVQGFKARTEWFEKIGVATASSWHLEVEMSKSDSHPIHPARVVAEVKKRLHDNAIIIGDGGDFVSFVGRMVESDHPGCFLDPGPFGCLGAGVGYAIAARLAHPERQVVVFNGDGAFGFSGMDFDTLIRHQLPVVAVIGNNGIWATEKHPMQNMLGVSIATDLRPGVRYDQVVQAMGGYGELVERPEDIGPAFDRAIAAGVPAVLNVLTDPKAEYPRSSALI